MRCGYHFQVVRLSSTIEWESHLQKTQSSSLDVIRSTEQSVRTSKSSKFGAVEIVCYFHENSPAPSETAQIELFFFEKQNTRKMMI